MALAQDKLGVFVKEDSESKKILLDVIVQKKLAVSKDVQDLVPYGIGIHHAGLSKEDRSLVEDLFAAGHL
jgi:pre-mRNA-splicing helicase BRR2